MSAFGLTYAMYVAIVGGTLIAVNPAPEATTAGVPAQNDWLFSYGRQDPDKKPVGEDGFLSVEYRPAHEIGWRFKPLYALGVSVDGAAYVSAAVRKDYRLGPVQITPYIGPALYQSKLGRFASKELLQFRTGFDVLVPLTNKVSVGLGYYHMSNAKITNASAGLDITRVSLQYRF
jgi:hypothetical protein